MCACVCVCVYARVCSRHSALAATAYGRARPAQRLARASQPGGRTAPGARRARRRPESEALLPPAGRAAPPRLRLRAARTRPPTTAKKKVQLRGLPQSYSCPGGRRRRREEPRPSRGRSLPAARFPPPRTSRVEGEVSREEDAVTGGSPAAVGRVGALTSARLIPAARGPARGSGAEAALSEAAGARSAGCEPCRRGGRRSESAGLRAAPPPPPPPLLLPPVPACGGLSRRSRSSPHATD